MAVVVGVVLVLLVSYTGVAPCASILYTVHIIPHGTRLHIIMYVHMIMGIYRRCNSNRLLAGTAR